VEPLGSALVEEMRMTSRLAAYMFALAAIAITVPLTVAAGERGIAVAVLGWALAVTPFVLVRAIEELMSESAQSRRT
jgi:hypothetical protein